MSKKVKKYSTTSQIMYFDNVNRKNHKITFSIVLVTILLAASTITAIYSPTGLKEALGQSTYDPVHDCFIQNGDIQDINYGLPVSKFEGAVPNDQVFINVAKTINLSMQNTADLSTLIAKQYYISNDNNVKINNELVSLLASSGFTSDQQNSIGQCFANITPFAKN